MADPVADETWAFLRGHTTADLSFDEHVRPLRYVIDPGGRLVAPAMAAMLTAVETVLFVPEYGEDALELLVTLEPFEEQGEGGVAADRWRIYHGEPEDVRWGYLDVDAGKFRGNVIDGEALGRPNPLTEAEPALCRELNERSPSELQRLCACAGVDSEAPVVVGLDPLGIDIRRRFDVIRVAATSAMTTADEARRVVVEMIGEATDRLTD